MSGPSDDSASPVDEEAGSPLEKLSEAGQDAPEPTHVIIDREEASLFVGPLPSPSALREYDETLPGCAERIVAAWEGESDHRRGLELRAARTEERGQIFALSLAVLFLAVSALLIYSGHGAAGIAVVLAEIVALSAAFLYDRRAKQEPAE